jgi:hypothetical protein
VDERPPRGSARVGRRRPSGRVEARTSELGLEVASVHRSRSGLSFLGAEQDSSLPLQLKLLIDNNERSCQRCLKVTVPFADRNEVNPRLHPVIRGRVRIAPSSSCWTPTRPRGARGGKSAQNASGSPSPICRPMIAHPPGLQSSCRPGRPSPASLRQTFTSPMIICAAVAGPDVRSVRPALGRATDLRLA